MSERAVSSTDSESPDGDRRTGTELSRRGLLTGIGAAGVAAATGAASGAPRGQEGSASQAREAVYTAELNGPVTDEGSGPQAVTDLTGTLLNVDGESLSAEALYFTVSDGDTEVINPDAITFGNRLAVTDDGDGTVTLDR